MLHTDVLQAVEVFTVLLHQLRRGSSARVDMHVDLLSKRPASTTWAGTVQQDQRRATRLRRQLRCGTRPGCPSTRYTTPVQERELRKRYTTPVQERELHKRYTTPFQERELHSLRVGSANTASGMYKVDRPMYCCSLLLLLLLLLLLGAERLRSRVS